MRNRKYSAEFVFPGHPDKLCDAIADALVQDASRRQKRALVGIEVAGRTYVSPSRPIPIAKWDYTSGDGVRRTFELGREDGAAFVRDWLRRAAA